MADCSAVNPGQLAGVAGYPLYLRGTLSVTSGRMSKVFGNPNLGFDMFIQTDAPVNASNSGGMVFDECGRVIGMAVLKPVPVEVEGIGWAIAENIAGREASSASSVSMRRSRFRLR